MENSNEVVTKSELKQIRLVEKLEDTVAALTDYKEEADKENEKLTNLNDRLKRENARLMEQNREIKSGISELRRENADLLDENNSLTSWVGEQKKEHGAIKFDSDKKILVLQEELKSATEKIAEQAELLAKKPTVEAEQQPTVEKVPEQTEVAPQDEKESDFVKFLAKPVITEQDLVTAGAIIDKWDGTTVLNGIKFRKQFLKNSWVAETSK